MVELARLSEQEPRGISALRRRMTTYISNSAQLGWLLLPEQQSAEIWRAGRPCHKPECIKEARQLKADPVLHGVYLDLT